MGDGEEIRGPIHGAEDPKSGPPALTGAMDGGEWPSVRDLRSQSPNGMLNAAISVSPPRLEASLGSRTGRCH